MNIDDILTKDRIKTREINLLVAENRALQARLAALTAALETARTLWFNALFDQGTPRELHVIWFNEWLAKLDAAGGA